MAARLAGLVVAALAAVSVAGAAPPKDALTLLASAPKPGTINSDLAFWGRLAFQGSYDGFRVIDISRPANPVVLADVACHGPQGDISVWQNLVFVSVDRPQTSAGCDSRDTERFDDPSGWEGIRIFDVADPRNPRLVTTVATDCGSHTHTLVPDTPNGRVLLYVSSFATRSGARCGPGAESPLHGKLAIVGVPLAAPETASVVATPPVQAGVFRVPIRDANPTVGCHDITVFLPLKLAAAACMSEGQLWDISDPANPKTLAAVRIKNPAFHFWHSAAFSNDGKTVVFGDESFNGSCADPRDQDGRLWFYSVAKRPKLLASYLIPSRRTKYCSVHLFNPIPRPGRNVLVGGWYMGGTDVLDFTNAAKPARLAGATPRAAEQWAAYWYDGIVYASDMLRGFDVFALSGPANTGGRRLGRLNPQTQELLIPSRARRLSAAATIAPRASARPRALAPGALLCLLP